MRWQVKRDPHGDPCAMLAMWGLTAPDVAWSLWVCVYRLLWLANQRGLGGRWVLAVPRFEEWFSLGAPDA